jgi:hypothetical protein
MTRRRSGRIRARWGEKAAMAAPEKRRDDERTTAERLLHLLS